MNLTIVLLLCLFSASLRWHAIGLSSYWIDEMVSLHFAGNPSWRALFWDNTPFFYHLLLKGWLHLLGTNEVATRSLSALFSVTTTGILAWFGGKLYGRKGMVLFGLIHALSFVSVIYAQETRMYSLFELAAAVNLIAFYRYQSQGRGIKFLVASFIFLVLSHYLSLVILVFELGWLFARRGIKRSDYKVLVPVSALALVLLVFAYRFSFDWSFLNWQNLKFAEEPQSRWPGGVLWDFGNRSWFSLIGLFALSAFSVLPTSRTKEENAPIKTTALFYTLEILGTLIIAVTVTWAFRRSIFLPRYYIFLEPPFVISAGMGFFRLLNWKPKMSSLGVLFLCLYVGASLIGIKSLYRPVKAPWREVASVIYQYQQSIVLTTKTQAVQTPYFEEKAIPLERWKPVTQGKGYITQLLDHYKNVFVVENAWGSLYFSDLIKALYESNLSVTSSTTKTYYSEPLEILWIRRPPQSGASERKGGG